jgi:hypothetical protein
METPPFVQLTTNLEQQTLRIKTSTTPDTIVMPRIALQTDDQPASSIINTPATQNKPGTQKHPAPYEETNSLIARKN